MSHKQNNKKGFTTFVKSKQLGKCPCCDKNVHDDQLYVEEEGEFYHYSCYNFKKAEEK